MVNVPNSTERKLKLRNIGKGNRASWIHFNRPFGFGSVSPWACLRINRPMLNCFLRRQASFSCRTLIWLSRFCRIAHEIEKSWSSAQGRILLVQLPPASFLQHQSLPLHWVILLGTQTCFSISWLPLPFHLSCQWHCISPLSFTIKCCSNLLYAHWLSYVKGCAV